MRQKHREIFTTIKTEGNLLPIDLLHRIAEGGSGLKGLTPDSYHLTKNERLNEIINRACPACPVGQNDRTGACPACPVAPEDGTGVGSGNPTGVNSYSACLRAPREIHISDSAAYFTGVAKSDRITVKCLNLVHQVGVIPLGFTPPAQLNVFEFLFNRGGIFPIPLALSSEFRIPSSEFGNAPSTLCYALCPLRHALYVMRHACYSTGALPFQKKVFQKSSTSSVLVELFYFYSGE